MLEIGATPPDLPKSVKTSKPAKATKRVRIEQKPMTIEQFKSYLNGIAFVGGDDWSPDATQWAAIVGIVNQLVVDQPQPQRPEFGYPQQTYVAQHSGGFPSGSPTLTAAEFQSSLAPIQPPSSDDGTYVTPFV